MGADREIESLLQRYRPAGPAPGLRDRLLTPPVAAEPIALRLWRYAAVVAVATSVSLIFASSAPLDPGLAVASAPDNLPPQVQTAVAVLGGDEPARRYVAMTIALESQRPAEPVDPIRLLHPRSKKHE